MMICRNLVLLVMVSLLGGLAGVSAVGAEAVADRESAVSSAAEPIWQDGIGSGFRKNSFEAGFALGAGFGAKAIGSRVSHDLALAFGHLGWIFSDVMAKDSWYRGNWELRLELFSGAQFDPEVRYAVGGTPILRYNFVTHSPWVPFVEAGAGLSATDIDRPDLSTTFQFNTQVGLGTHYFIREQLSMTLQSRGFHFSNAGIKEPNRGTNTLMFLLGLSWFF